MKINPRDLIIILLIAVGFYYYLQSFDKIEQEFEPPEIVQEEMGEEQVVEEQVEEVTSEPQKPVQAEIQIPTNKPDPKAKYPNLDDSFAPFDQQGNRYLTQINQVGKHLVYDGDVLIGKAEDLPRLLKNKVIKTPSPNKWIGGQVPYRVDLDLPNFDQVMEAIEYINAQTYVQFVRWEDQANYVSFVPGEQDCYSYAGMIGGMQEVFLTPRCGIREILHEIMHTIGFFHEQNREDRDQYLKILWDNIEEVHHPQFKKLPNAFIGLVGRPFDFDSIMLYSSQTFASGPDSPAMLTKDDEVIPKNENLLSNEDIKRVNLAYPRF